MRRGAWLALCAAVLCAAPARAQGQDPVGPFVVDVRGLMAALPTAAGWIPTVPAGTVVPSRGFGIEAGAHVYPVEWGPARLGLGAALGIGRGTAIAADAATPDVTTRSSTFAPQVSLNFGHREGWSYLSAGYGAAKFVSEASAVGLAGAATQDPGWSGALNIGGGARWFVSEHFGVGFDARWHRVSGQDAMTPAISAPRTTVFHLAIGISIH